MLHFKSMWFSAMLSVAWFCLPMEAAQKNPAKQTKTQKQDEQRENEAVRKAQDQLNEVQKDLKKAESGLREAQQHIQRAVAQRQSAASALQKTIDRLEGVHADLTGLTAARRTLKAVQAEFDEKAKPVRKGLESQADFQAAQQALARAKSALQPADDDVTADRKQLAKDYATAQAKVRALEQAAFRRDAELTALQDKINLREKQVQLAVDNFEKAVERDGDLKAARKAFDDAKAAENHAEDARLKAAREVAAARSKAAQATLQLQQKKLQDARDDNRGKNKGKN